MSKIRAVYIGFYMISTCSPAFEIIATTLLFMSKTSPPCQATRSWLSCSSNPSRRSKLVETNPRVSSFSSFPPASIAVHYQDNQYYKICRGSSLAYPCIKSGVSRFWMLRPTVTLCERSSVTAPSFDSGSPGSL